MTNTEDNLWTPERGLTLPNRLTVAESLENNWIGTVVIKIGTNTLFPDKEAGYTQDQFLERLAGDIGWLALNGVATVVVSSGAIEFGWREAGYQARPSNTETVKLQNSAMVGNPILVNRFGDALGADRSVAQGLLTHQDLSTDEAWKNALGGFYECLRMGNLPVVNENDLTALGEMPKLEDGKLVFGDNDMLSAVFAKNLQMDRRFGRVALVMLTGASGILTDPQDPSTKIDVINPSSDTSDLTIRYGLVSTNGRGGMEAKLESAMFAAREGVAVRISSGALQCPVISALAGAGTNLTPISTNQLELF